MSEPVTDSSPSTALARLTSLPTAEFVWAELGGTTISQMSDEATVESGSRDWMKLQLAFAEQMARKLALGRPQILLSVHDERLLVVGATASVRVGLVLRDTGSAGMAMVTVRRWLDEYTNPDTT